MLILHHTTDAYKRSRKPCKGGEQDGAENDRNPLFGRRGRKNAQMLGTRRSSVTVATGMLEKAGLIAHSRGDIEIIDRKKLEEAACECYGLMQRQVKTWQGDVAQ